jgi:hypothetical protein
MEVFIYLQVRIMNMYHGGRRKKGKLCTYSFAMAVPIFENKELCPCYFAIFHFHLVHLEGYM